jgi:hypothetical protein
LEKNESAGFLEKADVRKNLGKVYGLLGKYSDAVEELEKCKSRFFLILNFK